MKKKPSTSFGARCASSCLLLVALCVAMCALVGLAWAFRRPKDFDAFFFFRPKGGVLQRTKKDYEGSSSSSSSSSLSVHRPAGGGDDIAHPKEEEEDNDDDEENNNNNNNNNRRRRKGPKGAQQNDDDVSLCDMTRWIHGKFQGDTFIPSGYTRTASLKPPRDLKSTKQVYHWFSKEEAQSCLKNKRVWVIGDSYMRNLFIGLMDVLRGNVAKPNESITKGVPEKFVKIDFLPKAFGDVGRAFLKSNNITATFIGGRRFGLGLYMEAIKALFSSIKNDDLIVFNVLIHDNKRNRVQSQEFKGDMRKAEQYYLSKVNEFVDWLRAQKPRAKIVWSTSTSYKENKVPSEFRRYQRNKRILDINRKARDIWIDAGFPVLDVFHLTLACQAKSCTEDGSHHNRMVNRAKAHVLMNYFCRPSSCDA